MEGEERVWEGKGVKGKRGRRRGEWQVEVDNMCNMMDILCMVSWNNVTAGTGRKRTRQRSKAEKRGRKKLGRRLTGVNTGKEIWCYQ